MFSRLSSERTFLGVARDRAGARAPPCGAGRMRMGSRRRTNASRGTWRAPIRSV